MESTLQTGAQPLILTVGTDDSLLTERVAAELAAPAALVDDPDWLARARRAWSDLPAELVAGLREFRKDSGPTGSMLVRGLPVGHATLPPTPDKPGSVQRDATVSAAVLAMVASGLGDPAAYRPEKTGAIVQDVVPVPGQEDYQSNAGSVLLTFHTENAFHPHRPDFVMLLCLRADHENVAGLRTACIREVLPLLTEESRQALFSKEFITAAPPSFGLDGVGTEPHAVLYGAVEDPDICVDLSATEPTTVRAKEAMAELQELFDRTAQTVRLVPGNLAIVDNRVTVHGRTPFRPRYDGQDRWLQRTFVLTDLRRSREHRDGDGYVLD
ncbi:TauD/TfdA family dioxygenase [Streptomyces natalensis]|uniref:L-asparagine oxygenase n=1 Tax=Streptomyces natalensis ATCC 27448 TaxID=1240678 RepID=A0A0D7CN41_9ACTN|nr:TauD/TfdA family dioxygenase [Streptomyces natalensis]KIZ17623.1 L-asparagine oxygenase [Streptomyces natalensis ATCC 27448]